jgi:hypothetical protein
MAVFQVTNTNVFIPEFDGNKNKDSPIEIIHKAPTMLLYNQLVTKTPIQMKLSPDGSYAGGEMNVTIDTSKFVKVMVSEIRNLSYAVDNGKEIHITKGSELFGDNVPSVFSGLAEEIGAYLQNLLNNKVIDQKN